jgi:hypothetical protein
MKNERFDEKNQRTRDSSYTQSSHVDHLRRAEERMMDLEKTLRMQNPDILFIPPEIVPPGWVYAYGRHSFANQEDTSRQLQLRMEGWTPVPSSRHPDMVASKDDTRPYIHRNSVVLYERPLALHQKRTAEIHQKEVTRERGIDAINIAKDPNLRFVTNSISRGYREATRTF